VAAPFRLNCACVCESSNLQRVGSAGEFTRPSLNGRTNIPLLIPMSVSPQVRLVQGWGNAFHTGDLALIKGSLHKDFRLLTYPQSVGEPAHNKDWFTERLRQVIPAWTESKVCHVICFSNPPSQRLNPSTDNQPFHHRGSRKGGHSRPYPELEPHCVRLTWYLPHSSQTKCRPVQGRIRLMKRCSSHPLKLTKTGS